MKRTYQPSKLVRKRGTVSAPAWPRPRRKVLARRRAHGRKRLSA